MEAAPPPKAAGTSASELLEKALASLDEAILVVNPATRAIVSCDKAAGEIFACPREEIIGRNTVNYGFTILVGGNEWNENFG